MATRFTRLRSVGKSYAEQGVIFFTCLTYEQQPKAIREKIDRLCRKAGGGHCHALFEYLTTSMSWEATTIRHNISHETLDRCRRKFYTYW